MIDVWTVIRRADMIKGKRSIGNRWVFKKKRNGVFRARLVGKGYHQIPGVDYEDSFAPVVNDVTLRSILVLYLQHEEWTMIGLDIVTAFLYGVLDEVVYMDIPDGFFELCPQVGEYFPTDELVLSLNKTIYGVVQAARAFNKEFNKCLESFKNSLEALLTHVSTSERMKKEL